MKRNKTIYPYLDSLEHFNNPNNNLKVGDFIFSTKSLLIKEINILYLSDPILSEHRRLSVFNTKGCKCVYCKDEGTRLLLTETPLNFARHIDLYTDELVLMTIDHVKPSIEGGKTEMENLVPCCRFCNNAKGKRQDLTVEEIVKESRRLKDKYLKQWKKA